MSAGKIILLVFGVIIILISIGLIFAGGALIWADANHIDDEGFINSDIIQIARGSCAVMTGSIDIDEEALRVLKWWGLITVFEIEGGSNNPSKQIFIGVAEESDLKAYLSGVDYDEMTLNNRGWLSSLTPAYTNHPGSSAPATPTSGTFWIESAYGTGTQTLAWETEVGSHSIVLMNDDGSSGIDLSMVFKVKIPPIIGLSIGLLIGGIVVLIIGGLMVYFAVRRSKIITQNHD